MRYPDKVTWKAGASATFTIRSQQLLQPPQPQDVAAEALWKATSPLKLRLLCGSLSGIGCLCWENNLYVLITIIVNLGRPYDHIN